MATTYSTAAKNARLDAVAALIDAGASPGKLKLYTAADALLVTFTLADPCAAAAAAGVLTFDFDPDLTAAAGATGTAAKATFTDSADTVVISGLTVGTSGADVIVDNTSINSGQNCTATACTITHG